MYDVIVAGGGPGGATAAAGLSSQGAVVLLLEAARMPRPKVCGGAVSAKISGQLGRGFWDLVHDEMREMVFTYRGRWPASFRSGEPYAYGIVREELDHYLFKAAARAGTEAHDGEPVIGVELEKDGVAVRTPVGLYRGRYMVGADGANSLVARTLGLAKKRLGVALEARVPLEAAEEDLSGKALVELGTARGGYSWVFAKRDHLNVGTGVFTSRKIPLKPLLKEYVKEVLPCFSGDLKPEAHPIPVLLKGQRLSRERVLVVGDAAGLVDPFFGEGIAWAVRSGQLAAEALLSSLGRGADLSGYDRAVREEILTELEAAEGLGRFFYSVTGFLHRHVLTKGRAVERFSRVVSGNMSYRDFNRWVATEAWKEVLRSPRAR